MSQKKNKSLSPLIDQRALSVFDHNHSRFAIVGNDNRLKVWDVAAGRLIANCVDPKHLSASYTCLTWGYAERKSQQPIAKKRGRKGQDDEAYSDEKVDLVALGTEQGTIVVWDLQTSQLLSQFSDVQDSDSAPSSSSSRQQRHSGRINDILFNATSTCLYTCGADGVVRQWDVKTGKMLSELRAEKNGVSVERIALSKDGSKLLSASSMIKQWDVASKKVTKRFAGHASQIRCLKFVDVSDDDLFISCAAGDRFVNLWGSAPRYESTASLQVLVHESSVASLDAFVNRVGSERAPSRAKKASSSSADVSGAKSVFISALNESGTTLAVWSFPVPNPLQSAPTSSLALQPHSLITAEPPSSSSSKQGDASQLMVSATLAQSSSPTTVLVARSTPIKPIFETVEYATTSASGIILTPAVALTSLKTRPLPPPSTSTTSNTDSASPEGEPVIVSQVQFPVTSSVRTAGSTDKSGVASVSDAATVRELLKKASQNGWASKSDVASSSSRAQSIHTVLAQAIHSNDLSLLEECLKIKDYSIIDQTIMKLPPVHVLPFIRIVVAKFHTTPARGVALAVWIRCILEQHTAYLLTVPDLVAQLTALYQLADSRVGIFKKVLRLSGRLDLILSQINKKERSIANASVHQTIRASFSLNDDESEEDESIHSGDDESDDLDQDSDASSSDLDFDDVNFLDDLASDDEDDE